MSRQTRRDFLRASAAATSGGILLPYVNPRGRTMADETRSPNERPRVGCIGLGGMGRGDAKAVKRYGDILAVCDVDRKHAEFARDEKTIGNGKADIYEDYRKLLDRNDIDIVTISTPDHWHTRIAIAALRAGKDVYCQKPLTLTIDEGKQLRKVVEETKRILQVGTQQRSEDKNRFLTAVAMVHDGRIGKVKRVTCVIGATPDEGKTFRKTEPPTELNWEMWLGQAPKVDYIAERCHNNFRWWYEYSGGKMTDWGAHHVDIAQWAIGMDQSGPKTVEVLSAEHPVPFKDGMPMVDDRYNTATAFLVRCLFPNDVELLIRHDTENGVEFEGEKGSFFVSRSKLVGEPVDELDKNPIPESALIALRKGKRLDSHMGNFIECVRDRATPVSDVASHHRMLTTCHLANIALRLGRSLTWDPVSEQIVGDPDANKWLGREQRKGYEIDA
ncbi:Gfo/Idh/MocA family protein [Singulisphaera acidiphila]|uniref:Putative dehydrogenase n=1 Tax=Singulisphaera acidiphila (strain ATCC BAA-1392 / DSM 18658 / VKM B-2454 / MOB10) TaxID=886293 RepID=L0DP80_SINAD|nr:Gfo/Idh/MocA family oxidoreductase [Singulisphaera acidiphila]AGA31067.1 putative dehydrogenase [Singulisphaera acidiphila DSM 18658]